MKKLKICSVALKNVNCFRYCNNDGHGWCNYNFRSIRQAVSTYRTKFKKVTAYLE